MPKISIIVPIYNVEEYLPRCLKSIIDQSFKDFEVILINEIGTDNSGVICEEFASQDSRIRLFQRERGGVAGARNVGLRAAIGEYITFVDADDFLEDAALEKMYNKAVETNVDIVICDYTKIFKNKIEPVYRAFKGKTEFINQLLEWSSIENALWAKLFKRHLFIDEGIYFIEKLDYGEDYSVLSRLFYVSNAVSKLDAYLYNYERRNVNAATNTKLTEKKVWDLVNSNRLITDFFQNVSDAKDYSTSLIIGKFNIRKAINGYGNAIKELGDLKMHFGMLPFSERLFFKLQERNFFFLAQNYSRVFRFLRHCRQRITVR